MPQLVDAHHGLNGVVVLTVCNPPVNAWSDDLIDDLTAAVRGIADSRARCAVITGGPDCFSAGGDFAVFRELDTDADIRDFASRVQAMTTSVAQLPMPSIAAINGPALGGGFELALACDIRIASPTATVGLPETRWGLIPGAGGTQRLMRLTSASIAKRLIFTAATLGPSEAQAVGLLDIVSAGADCRGEAEGIAAAIAANSPCAVRAAKRCIDGAEGKPLDAGLRGESEALIELLAGGDIRHGIEAFFARTRPEFTG